MLNHTFDATNRDGKTDTLSAGGNSGVDTDDFSSRVDEGATGIAGIDRSVGLKHVGEIFGLIDTAAVGGSDGATNTRNNAIGDGVLKFSEGVTDGDDGLARNDSFGIAESGSGKVINILYLKESDIIVRINSDDFYLVINGAVGTDDANFLGIINNVFISDDVAISGNDKAGARTSNRISTAEKASSLGLSEDGNNARCDFISNFRDRIFGKSDGIISAVARIINDFSGTMSIRRDGESKTTASE